MQFQNLQVSYRTDVLPEIKELESEGAHVEDVIVVRSSPMVFMTL
jgi:hypothetical protein